MNLYRQCTNKGSALLLVLGLTALVGMVLIAMLMMTTRDHRASDRDSIISQVDLLAEVGLAESLAKLQEGVAVNVGERRTAHMTASPGLMEIRRFDVPWNRGSATGADAFSTAGSLLAPFESHYEDRPANPRWIPLFSWKSHAPGLRFLSRAAKPENPNPNFNPGLLFNINTPHQPFYPGVHYLSGFHGPAEGRSFLGGATSAQPPTISAPAYTTNQTTAERPVWVQWIPMLKDPRLPAGPNNPLVGRYAYWIDVENTKVNLVTATRPLRDQSLFATVLGDAEPATPHTLGTQNPSRIIRQQLEDAGDASRAKQLVGNSSTAKQIGTGFSPVVARQSYESWLGWQNNQPPLVADSSLIDWDSLLQPASTKTLNYRPDELLTKAAHQLQNPEVAPLQSAWDIVHFPSQQETPVSPQLRQLAASVLTTHGYEEEVDPLGNPRIDLVKFQRSVLQGGIQAILDHPLWDRLHDSKYYLAYYPGAYPTGNAPKSLVNSLNRFSGDGSAEKNENGEAAMIQLLTNVAEYASPINRPPLIDRVRGIVGARSMPYIAEVTTRARSALWLLPEDLRSNASQLLARDEAGNFTFEYQGKPLSYFLTNVVIDVAFAPVNNNPLETSPFEGTLEVDFTWENPPTDAQLASGPLRAPLQGFYNAMPSSGKKPEHVRLAGNVVSFSLGIFPAAKLDLSDFATCLRIRGWKIYRGNDLWHEVPVRHPGMAQEPRPWWAMAAAGENAGSFHDTYSLASYQYATAGSILTTVPAPDTNPRAVGWFTMASRRLMKPNSIFAPEDWLQPPLSPEKLKKLNELIQDAQVSARVDRVSARDPILGHRTGNPEITGLFGRGHFYGMLGHPWRRLPLPGHDDPITVDYRPPLPGQTLFETREMESAVLQWNLTDPVTKNLSLRQVRGITLANGNASLRFERATATLFPQVKASYTTHFWIYPFANQVLDPDPPDSPTAFMICPAIEGNFPMIGMNVKRVVESTIPREPIYAGQDEKAAKSLRDIDVETSTPINEGDHTKIPSKEKGPRSFFCHAPRGQPMTSLGELGFVHSGFACLPILVGPDVGRTIYQINSPQSGPPMRMLLDLFVPGAITAPDGRAVTKSQWETGNFISHGPSFPRHGTWNVNTHVAHDQYLALRQGGMTRTLLKTESYPTTAAWAVWMPGADGHLPRAAGNESHRGKEVVHLFDPVKPVPGAMLDAHLSPFPSFARGWRAWLNVLGGDFTPQRTSGGRLWGVGNNSRLYFGSGAFTWMPGRGLGVGTDKPTFIDFDPASPALGKVFAFGTDGRKNDKPDNAGMLKGRWAADQNLSALSPNATVHIPANYVTRLSLAPMRHFLSDLSLELHGLESFTDVRTAINPAHDSRPVTNHTQAADSDYASFAGGWCSSGIYYHAPLALMTNQASTSANAFTIHLVAQMVSDNGKALPDQANSGVGFSDSDDTVLTEKWLRVTVEKTATSSAQLKVLRRETK